MPALMVMPDREMPGSSAKAWERPTTTPSVQRPSARRRTPRPTSEVNIRITPVTMSATATSHGSEKTTSMGPPRAKPTMAAGMVPTTSSISTRRDSGSVRRWSRRSRSER